MSDDPKLATWDWPSEWSKTLPIDQKAFYVREPDICAILLLFPEGTNGIVLAFPGGVRYARMAPDTGYSLEERFDGKPPSVMDERDVTKGWRFLLDSFIEGGKQAEAELGGRP